MPASTEQALCTYHNPVLPGFNPDPSVIRVGPDFFCVTSSFEYFPGAPIYHSSDLISWTLIGHALTRREQLYIATPEPGGGVWATTLRFYQGWFYIITNSFDRYRPQADDRVWPRGFYVRTQNIWDDSTWSNPVYFDQVGFDFDLFWDDDGTAYLSSTYRKVDRDPNSKLKDFAIHVSTVNLETGELRCPPQLIRESPSGIAEGSHLFKRNGYYYLFTAEGGTESGHCEYVHRSRVTPIGPWEEAPHNPLWRNTTDDEIQNTGHCDLVEDESGEWWAMCLGVRPLKDEGGFRKSIFGRETMLLPVRWENDWPILNEGKPVSLEMKARGKYVLPQTKAWRDNFASSQMSLGWYRKNTPPRTDFSLDCPFGCLTLYGGPYTLSMPTCPTLFLRRQTHHSVTWRTQLDFRPQYPLTESGAVLWWNYTCFASIGIRLSDTRKRIVRFTPPVQTQDIREIEIADEHEVELSIESSIRVYRFGFRRVNTEGKKVEEEEWKFLGEVDTEVMTRNPDIGQPFTGIMMGLYSYGELQPVLTPARFKFAEFA